MYKSVVVLFIFLLAFQLADAQLASTRNQISLGTIDVMESQRILIPIFNQSREDLTLQYSGVEGNQGLIGGPRTLESYESDMITKSITGQTTKGKFRSTLTFVSDEGKITVRVKARIKEAYDPSCYRFDQKEVKVRTSGKYVSGSTRSETIRIYSKKDKKTLFAADPEKIPYAHLVILVDASGSMGTENKLGEIKSSLYDLIDELRPTDQISILRYSEETEVLADKISCEDKATIKDIVYNIEAGGFTNGKSGIEKALNHARNTQRSGYSNNVIMLTDGAFNLGQDQEGINRFLLGQNRTLKYKLSVLTIDTDPENEKEMKELSNSGNGYYFNLSEDSNTRNNRNKILIKQLST